MALTLAQLAVPQIVRRKRSGRYSMRLREVGKTSLIITIGLQTTDRRIAMNRLSELAATAKAFLLDNNNTSTEELREHLKEMAENLLMSPAASYWSDLMSDASANLKELSVSQAFSVAQHGHIVESLKMLKAVEERLNGNSEPLLSMVGNDQSITGHVAPAKTAIFNPKEEPKALSWSELSSVYRAEHMVNLKPASQADIVSAHKTLNRFTGSINWRTHSRAEVTAMRDSMIAEGLAPSTVNKLLAKLSACINWAKLNGHINHDYTKGLKLRGIESSRKAFSEEELKAIAKTVCEEPETIKRLYGQVAMITGARAGEVAQLLKEDIKEADGVWVIDINDNGPKTLKTKHSKRCVPLTDGALGFALADFLSHVEGLSGPSAPVFNMSRDVASKWFNEKVLPKAMNKTPDHVLHSLRHTVASRLKVSGCSETDAESILGHASQSLSFSLYGKGQAIGRIAEALRVALKA
ncbi:tyrosine-type recombinase/integrase [Pantoea agglomerans]|uniref:tyrosine-type recombinase/integrase n=1 Tax=Enterobacter agglomerans TaxID=549 RepID=UPI0009B8B03E|nr:tyrosine-type recombinase/integrase [Pantoea agglomerans]MBA5704814.1 hypothetical protein [Pantoea agglomerans]